MLSVIQRLFSIPWIYRLTHIYHYWRSQLVCIFRPSYPLPYNLQPLTDHQRKLRVTEFIDSIDTDAVCALASRYNGGLTCSIRCRQQGSFNVCFILDFADGTTRLVRLPIEPAVHDVWDKVCSEVYTMQYIRDHTDIPVAQVYAYGRSQLRRGSSARQVFIVLDYIDGQPLTRKMLRDSPEPCRRKFFGEVVDMFAQLRRLEFPQGGSLMPNEAIGVWPQLRKSIVFWGKTSVAQSNVDLRLEPKIVGAFSMRKNELQVDGYTAPRFIATTANEFLHDQYRLLQYMWRMPSQDLGREEAEREEFALHVLSLEEAQKTFTLDADSSGDSFYLCHPDLRVNNIIVDDELHIRGVIDWEFAVTVPRHAFLPPSWITTGSIIRQVDLASEFMSVLLSKKQQSSSHSQLAQDWDFPNDYMLPMAYIFRDPSDLVWLFYERIYPGLYTDPADQGVSKFFQLPENKELLASVERRLRVSEQYTQYLKDNNLLDDDEDEPEWQQLREWTADARKTLEKLQQWSDETQEELKQMDEERAVQRGREQHLQGVFTL